MKIQGYRTALLLAVSSLLALGVPERGLATSLSPNSYVQTNLVANKSEYNPLILDPTFVNAWGIAIRPAGLGGHFWVTGNGSGISYEYVGDVNGVPLYQDDLQIVTVPGPNGTKGTPTGVVFNGSNNFAITQNHPNGAITGPSKFLFATDNGVISGWTERKNPDGTFDRPSEALAVIDRSSQGSQYFGLGITTLGDRLYAADFGINPGIQVFDGAFNDITISSGFTNPFAGADGFNPGDFTPFNIQTLTNSGGLETAFVPYAKSQEDPNNPGQVLAGEEESGPGNGRLAEFDLAGNLIRTWDDRGLLNSPWGVAFAPSNFGAFSNTLLVSNFGDGTIVAFDPNTYRAIDYLRDPSGQPISIPGIWGLLFGNGASLGDADSLYFAAGPEDEEDGVFGRLRVTDNTATVPEPSGIAGIALVGLWGICRLKR
ncbi:TIGR03118 family protein [Chroococcus sp. FPU101]|uniref:TIGR03118 family protein n=1 Tax=Chroococcus sp. FPU101 TaxID=1974212 RepID=UPI001A9053E2|nr:TIGR03118 family protein [Chroococcus sp. FPU101]GFE68976.1 hypothetical protein CFPU101_15860 [Chroococcus sp. FPU101]